MFSSFAAKLNKRAEIDPQHPVGRDNIANSHYWFARWSCVDDKNISRIRKMSLAIEREANIFSFVGVQSMLAYIAYHLWYGDHIDIPKVGMFKVRNSSSPNSFRSVRFLPSKELKAGVFTC